MPASVSKIGHIVLKVEDLDSALAFYCGVLGLKEVARRDFGEGPMAFLSTGNSHNGIAVHMSLDHRVSQGIYIPDPDGNLIELYVDADETLWRNDPSLVANSDPFNL